MHAARYLTARSRFRGGVIEAVGTTAELAALIAEADEVIDARGCVVTPGLVNTHHHLFQSLTRAVPGAVNAPLFGWLKCLYPIWAQLSARGRVRRDAARASRTGAIGLHAVVRPSVSFPRRRHARRHHPCRRRHRHPFPPDARRDERRRECRRPAARPPGRGRGRDPRRHDPRDRSLPRRRRRRDGARRRRAVLALSRSARG